MAYKKGGRDNDGDKPAPKRKPVGEDYDATFRGFINLNLSDAHKREFPPWVAATDVGEVLSRHCTDGVVVSIKVDTRSGGFMASGTHRRASSVNAGLAVTARASDPVTAFHRLLYMLEILPSDGWEKMQPMADPDRW